jgi:hypothetical protein
MNVSTLSRLALVLTGCLFGLNAVAEDEQPSGTVTIEELQVMVIVGGDHGHGTLSYEGADHPFKASGLKLGGVGVHKKDMHGSVYRLDDLGNFSGLYFLAEAGLTLAKGAGGLWLKNDKGVVMHLRSSTEGLALSIGVEGLKVSLDE